MARKIVLTTRVFEKAGDGTAFFKEMLTVTPSGPPCRQLTPRTSTPSWNATMSATKRSVSGSITMKCRRAPRDLRDVFGSCGPTGAA